MSKLMTSVAILHAVERSLVGLDDNVAEILPALREKEVLIAYDDITKVSKFQALTEKITLR
ncbi:hypothetical protein AYL99_03327 [Fonsecaea erecta]|uniref:Uncharacterized protein n=1 Tax=Fonsecaea erecta TaxID=1367422 RepID=A0A178ZP18_9EURO|nr:hypothetical protein AYL99_03327 [Fonsecaea erecta]OAP61126.1 hypothetical protein AYL99_03327 [Fonsecaea erecta]